MFISSMTKPFFIIELKSDLSLDDCVDFINALTLNGEKRFQNLYIAIPFYRLKEMSHLFQDSGITFGQDRMNAVMEGSFTAEVAIKMIQDAKGKFVLVGKAEERNIYKISDLELKAKLEAAAQGSIQPIYCVGGGIDISDDNLKKQISLLENNSCSKVIYELPFTSFERYLPSEIELKNSYKRIKDLTHEALGDQSDHLKLFASLPSDLAGFSSFIDHNPFDGAFFTKSGVYPHAVHNESMKLFHVHCESN